MSAGGRWGPVLAVLLVVVGASLVPLGGAGAGPFAADALAVASLAGHLAGYAALAWVLARALAVPGRPTRVAVGVAVAGSVLVGAGVELVQPLVGRTASVADAAVNAVGAALGALGWSRR